MNLTETNYQKGARKERVIVNRHRKLGRLAFRSAGSHSPVDVFVLDPKSKTIFLIQSKPKSMSENAKHKIYDDLKQYVGDYVVVADVE